MLEFSISRNVCILLCFPYHPLSFSYPTSLQQTSRRLGHMLQRYFNWPSIIHISCSSRNGHRHTYFIHHYITP
ncbi:hypothetical protein VIGAN_04362400 [Vigna angularis var. angularis]|uniref:Uncharacterized protein n=1 Tax=Vigna angularis var. angularis TaxID=157739 RepID=A0A0S3RZK2_PHAAN|nr:hypothetical protein VIGAN_04362400 [Vigna angularis var. angularis]